MKSNEYFSSLVEMKQSISNFGLAIKSILGDQIQDGTVPKATAMAALGVSSEKEIQQHEIEIQQLKHQVSNLSSELMQTRGVVNTLP